MSGDRLPWCRFHWADHARDVALRQCSMASRGLWMELLCLMADSPERGFLMVGSQAMTSAQIARTLGQDRRSVDRWMAELESNQVFARDGRGVIYSRRMVRDERRFQQNADNGKRGGNPVLLKISTLAGSQDNPAVKARAEQEQEQEQQQEQPGAAADGPLIQNLNAPLHRWAAVADSWEIDPQSMKGERRPVVAGYLIEPLARAVVEAAGFDPARSTYDLRPLVAWLKAGISPYDHILPTIVRIAGKANYRPPNTLAYFDAPIREAAGLIPPRARGGATSR